MPATTRIIRPGLRQYHDQLAKSSTLLHDFRLETQCQYVVILPIVFGQLV
ncbi:MAG: hypothetical protein IJ191_07960 [Treponema sp.]|nr:hypothetical protein [Treponema sp.]